MCPNYCLLDSVPCSMSRFKIFLFFFVASSIWISKLESRFIPHLFRFYIFFSQESRTFQHLDLEFQRQTRLSKQRSTDVNEEGLSFFLFLMYFCFFVLFFYFFLFSLFPISTMTIVVLSNSLTVKRLTLLLPMPNRSPLADMEPSRYGFLCFDGLFGISCLLHCI